jgi:hypothetical protein
MKAKLIATALGALLLTGSTLALAEEWRMRDTHRSERHLRHDRGHDRGWSDHDRRDWGRDHKHYRGHGRGHWKPYWHHKYRHHDHYRPYGHWRPYGYDHDGVTIIFRGSF